ncbi:MAG: FAD-dependent oxidoreductase [Pseudomonadota bacterium]
MDIAVIGAGAAGLATARELIRAGHRPTIYEQSTQVGGVWVYEDSKNVDPLGVNTFSSLYDSLRTNLPRDLMAFHDYTFDSAGGGNDGWPRYPHHTRVLEYLQNFAKDSSLLTHIQFDSRVSQISPAANNTWTVSTDTEQRDFGAVAICNGHYTKPKIPGLEGIEHFGGIRYHAHNYRNPQAFKGKNVLLWGTAASGVDLCREIASVANTVYWCGSTFSLPATKKGNTYLYPSPTGINASGHVLFEDGSEVKNVDVFMYCTGYEYHFPFLAEGVVSVEDNKVSPLYQELLPPERPTLAFIGIPYMIIPFPLFMMQARWFARMLANQFQLPSVSEMYQQIRDKEQRLLGQEARHFHQLGDLQFEYINNLAQQCAAAPLPAWYQALAAEAQAAKRTDPDGYRDKFLKQHGPSAVAAE